MSKTINENILERQARAEKVNRMIMIIGMGGRNFFRREGRYARAEVDFRGRVWWIDDYSGRRIYTHRPGTWRWFTHGGTLKGVVESFRDYIAKGRPLPKHIFGPWPDDLCGGDLWGYGDYMETVRNAAKDLGLFDHPGA